MAKKIILAALATVIVFLVMRWLSVELKGEYSPMGIISFELAKNYAEAKNIMNTISVTLMQISTGVDFIFIIAYTLFFSFCCKALMNNYRSSGIKTIGFIFLELSILVGVLDLVENVAMLITLGGYGSNLSVTITRWAAILKFSLAGIVLLYIIIGSLIMLIISKKKV